MWGHTGAKGGWPVLKAKGVLSLLVFLLALGQRPPVPVIPAQKDERMNEAKADGGRSGHRFTNRLINESSPYLRQHAHNPVDWYPWGSEALEQAQAQDKPILLSIGYSACHWCHVMERESFENEDIARIMNQHFINIKVDREERPDLDTIYMNYVQLSTGSGGWPMTVFLTPEQVPFFGGTYFPPDDRMGRPGFPRLLLAVADAYRQKKNEISAQTSDVLKNLRSMSEIPAGKEPLTLKVLETAFENLAPRFDWTHGGFGGAPKFPNSMNLSFLLRHYRRTDRADILRFVELTLQKMAHGGMYDHLGGGFHRYSVDDHWLVPHFEKMLYDNALLSRLYLQAYQLTGKHFYKQVTEEILDYVLQEMTDPNGGFYSTQDADSEGEEGKFFVWTPEEVIATLGEREGQIFCLYYDVTPRGNFEGKNILNIPRSLEGVAQGAGISAQELSDLLKRGRAKLFQQRERRIKPHRDEKVLTGWNGWMLASFAEAAPVLDRADYLEAARRNAQFLLANLYRNKRLLRTWKDGQSKLNGYLEDYSGFVEGLMALYQATGERNWLENAVELTDIMVEQFWDESESNFFLTGKDHEKLITRVKDVYDNATPAGSSVAVLNLLKLSLLTGNSTYRRLAEMCLVQMQLALSRFPAGFGYLLEAADFSLGPVKEVAVIGPQSDSRTRELLEAVHSLYLPNKVLAVAQPDDAGLDSLPLLAHKTLVGGRPAAYVCQNYTCKSPVTEATELRKALQN
ncbi:MAG: thioredoxin domain-containing protein [Acidobacteriota bacterium]